MPSAQVWYLDLFHRTLCSKEGVSVASISTPTSCILKFGISELMPDLCIFGKVLGVQFDKKHNWVFYQDVPESVFHEFKGASSAGKFYNQVLKQQYLTVDTSDADVFAEIGEATISEQEFKFL